MIVRKDEADTHIAMTAEERCGHKGGKRNDNWTCSRQRGHGGLHTFISGYWGDEHSTPPGGGTLLAIWNDDQKPFSEINYDDELTMFGIVDGRW
jgi:hypothetical protein